MSKGDKEKSCDDGCCCVAERQLGIVVDAISIRTRGIRVIDRLQSMPAILSRGLVPALRRHDVIVVRLLASASSPAHVQPAAKQLTLNEHGFFKYERDRSRDSSEPNPQKPGDTPRRCVFF